MSSRVAGAGLALIAAALLAVSMAAPAVLPGLSLFAGHPTVRNHTRETQTVYVGLYGAQLCNTGGDGTCTSGSPRPAFRIAAYGELGATGLLAFSASVLAILTLAKSERRKGAGKLVRIASLPAMAGAAALALLGPFDEASVPLGLGVGLLGGGIVSAMVASVIAVRPPPPIKLRVAASGAPSMPRSPQSSAAIPASQPFDMAIFDADLRSAEPRMRRDSRPRPLASGSVPAPSQSADGFAPPAQVQGPLFSSAPQLRPLYEAMPSQGGTGGLMPIERPVIPSRAPTPIPRDDLSAFTGMPSRPEVAPEPRIEPPFAPPPPAPIAPAIEAPIEPGAHPRREHAPSVPPPAPRSKAPSVPPPTPRSRPASMAPPPPASPNTQVSLVPPMPDHELAPHRSDAWAVITDAPRPESHAFPRAETPLAPPPAPIVADPPEAPSQPPPPVAATAAPMTERPPAPATSASALTVETAPLIPIPQPVAPPPERVSPPSVPPPAPPRAAPPAKRSTLPPPRAQRPTNAPPQRPNDTAQPPLRAAVPMPARPQRPTAPPVIPVLPPRRPGPTAPPPNLSNIPAIPALPKRIETEADDRGDSFDPAELEPASTIPPEVSDPAGHTDVSVSLPADTSPSGEPAAPAPTNPEVPKVGDQAQPAQATAAASSPALPAVRERPMPKLPISTAPDSLPPPRDEKQANGPSPACPQCEAPMAWVEEHLRFYCKSCRMYF